MKTVRLTSKDNLNAILSECIDDGWTFEVDPKKLRIAFTNKEGTEMRTVRIGSIKNHGNPSTKELMDKIEQLGNEWFKEAK